MKLADLDKYIQDNQLLKTNVYEKPGIYAITIDDHIAYIGQSKNVKERCKQHIYNTQNAMLNKEKKYLLLLAAQLGGYRVDCVGIKYGEEEAILEAEAYFINEYNPCLNINVPGGRNNIDDLKIGDVLSKLEWQVGKSL